MSDKFKLEALLKGPGFRIAQDEATSVVWRTPGSVVNVGLADSAVARPQVVPEILRRMAEAG